ncbi:hypothetical protein CHS0354_029210 [Potamilus streckersoni]|uniref:Uncharacterized protein n=1 Tax=Potamilus streckersoni TaxID=2493646 RepID=A0AAE0TG27_9BIVA|nr:hypothetical protein CHS0354_029210 [Potamilus streckersoni]
MWKKKILKLDYAFSYERKVKSKGGSELNLEEIVRRKSSRERKCLGEITYIFWKLELEKTRVGIALSSTFYDLYSTYYVLRTQSGHKVVRSEKDEALVNLEKKVKSEGDLDLLVQGSQRKELLNLDRMKTIRLRKLYKTMTSLYSM